MKKSIEQILSLRQSVLRLGRCKFPDGETHVSHESLDGQFVHIRSSVGPHSRGRTGKEARTSEETEQPEVEVVFCLDTTGSMGGLIDAAKQKIWAISNQIAGGKPTPELKVGLVAYRDRGDAYVTKVFDLTDDLDAIHTPAHEFPGPGRRRLPRKASTRPCTKRSHKIKWSKDKKTLKIIFLVGDAPPHMDYPDDVKYPETCKMACQERHHHQHHPVRQRRRRPAKYWKEICRLAEGSYVQIDSRGGPVVVVATPFDARSGQDQSSSWHRSTLGYGSRSAASAEAEAKADAAACRLPVPPPIARASTPTPAAVPATISSRTSRTRRSSWRTSRRTSCPASCAS